MSSKFNPAVRGKSPIPYCIPPPDPPFPPLDEGWPPYLIASLYWADHDPAAYAHATETVRLTPVVPYSWWSGISPPATARLELHIVRVGTSDDWNMLFLIWDPWRNPEFFQWFGITAQPPQPLRLLPPDDIFVPGEDERSVQVYA